VTANARPLYVVRRCGGTVSSWLAAKWRCCYDAVLETGDQCTARYCGAVPSWHRRIIIHSLYLMCSGTSSQWRSAGSSCIRPWSNFHVPLTTSSTLAAAFNTHCSLARRRQRYSNRDVTKACTSVVADSIESERRVCRSWRRWGWYRFVSLGHPSNFSGFHVLVSLLQRRRSMEANQILHDVWPPGLVHYIYIFGGSCPVMEFCQVWHSLCIQVLRSPISAALLHGTLVVGVSQTLRRRTEGATYIWQGGHHVGHWPTF